MDLSRLAHLWGEHEIHTPSNKRTAYKSNRTNTGWCITSTIRIPIVQTFLLLIMIAHNHSYSQSFPIPRVPDWIPDTGGRAYDISFADINNDGWLDFIGSEEVQVFYNIDGNLQTTVGWSSPDAYGWRMALGDVDGDGDLDLAMGSYNVGERICYNINGVFESAPSWRASSQTRCLQIKWGDINLDGHLDLVSIKNDAFVVFYNKGDKLETVPSWRSTDGNGNEFKLGDVDEDGDLDLIAACFNRGIKVYLNNGTAFSPTASWSIPGIQALSVDFVDVNNDDMRDITVGGSEGAFHIFLNKNGIFPTNPDQTLNFGNGDDIGHHYWMDVDSDNDLDLFFCGFWISNEGGICLNKNRMIDSSPSWSVMGYYEINFAFADIDGSHTTECQEVFNGDGTRKFFYLDKIPIHSIMSVIVDGDTLEIGSYYVDTVSGWISFKITPSPGTGNILVNYNYSPYFDLAICFYPPYSYGMYAEKGKLIYMNQWPAVNLGLMKYEIKDYLGDDDGNIDPGETAELTVTLHSNGQQDACNVKAHLSSPDPFVTMIDSSISLGTIKSGDTLTSPVSFQISLSSEAPDPYGIWFRLDLQADYFYDSTYFSTRVGDSTGLKDDVESNHMSWYHQSIKPDYSDQWHISTKRNHTPYGSFSWKCGDPGSGEYQNLLDAGLITRPVLIDSNSFLNFWYWMDAELSNYFPDAAWDGGIVEISTDNDRQWSQITPIGDYPYKIDIGSITPFPDKTPCFSGRQDWTNVTFSLAEYAGREVQFRFRFGSDDNTTGEGWYLDDFVIESGLQKDIGILSISLPDSIINIDERIIPEATIYNFGSTTLSFFVEMRIEKEIKAYYVDSVFVVSMNPHSERVVQFKPWTPSEIGSYIVNVLSLFENDQNKLNDGLSNEIQVHRFTFQDVTVHARVSGTVSGGASGMAWGDYNNDGYQDIYVTYGGQSLRTMGDILYKNLMDGTFKDVSTSAGIAAPSYGSGVAFGDYDNDGNLDFFVTDMHSLNSRLFRNLGSGSFKEVSAVAGIKNLNKSHPCAWADVNNDGYLDLFIGNFLCEWEGYSKLFLNNRDGTFYNAIMELIDRLEDQCLSVAFGDYDNDGDQDLYIVQRNENRFFENDGSGKMIDVMTQAGLDVAQKSWSNASWGDYNNDGYLDLLLINVFYENRMYRNNGDKTFTDVALEAGIVSTRHGYSATWGDLDNDGYLDLYISTGLNNHDYLLHNNGNGSFTDVSLQNGMNLIASTVCSGFADYDRDGFLDLYVTRSWSEDSCRNTLYRNLNFENGNNWLIIELQGTISNRSGIGARVNLIADTQFNIREVDGGLGVFQNSLPVEFGLGKINKVDSLVIKWPSGIVDTYRDIQPNQYLIARENEELISGLRELKDKSMIPEFYILDQNYPNPFNSTTTIKFGLPEPSKVTLRVFNSLGQEIRTLIDKPMEAGYHNFILTVDEIPSGLYLYSLITTRFIQTRKMIIIR